MQVSMILTAIDRASRAIFSVAKANRAANAAAQKEAAKATQAVEKSAKAADKAAIAHKKSGKAVEAATAAAATGTDKYSIAIAKAEKAYADLWKSGSKGMSGTKKWTSEQKQQMQDLREEVNRLSVAQERMYKRRERWNKSLESIGGQIGQGLGQPINGMRQIGHGLLQGGKTAAGLYSGAGAYGAIATGVSHEIVGPAKEMEQFELALRNTGKSAEQAKQSLKWVRDQSLPFLLTKSTEAMVNFVDAGIAPTSRSFKLMGDAAIAKQKSIADAADAVKQALKGSTSALSDYGIEIEESAKNSKYLEYTFTGNDGRQKVIRALAKSQKAQEQAILKIFETKYGGATERHAATWEGMWMRAQQAFESMRLKIADAGVFDFLRGKFSEILTIITDLEKSGELDKWAKRISDNLIDGIKIGWEVMKGFGTGIKWVAEQLMWLDKNVISFQNQGRLLLALPFLPALLSIGSGLFSIIFGVARLGIGLTRLAFFFARIIGFSMIGGIFKTVAVAARIAGVAFMFLGRAIMMTPIGWIIAGITAIAVGAYLIYRNWDKIGPWFSALWQSIKTLAAKAWNAFVSFLGTIGDLALAALQVGWDGIKALFGWTPLGLLINNWGGLTSFFEGWGDTALEAIQTAFGKIKEWIGPAAEGLGQVFSKISEGVAAVWNAIFSGSGENAQKSLADGLTANPAQLATVEAATAGIKSNMEAIAAVDASKTLTQVGGLSDDAAKASEAIGKLTGATRDAIQGVKNYLNNVNLSSYGVAMMTTLASGIRGGAGQAVQAVRDVTQQMRDHLPHSPAKVGPLSDLHRIKFSETLASGIKAGPAIAAVSAVAAGMMAALPLSSPALGAPMSAGLPAGQSGGGAGVSVTYSPSITIQGGGSEAEQKFSSMLREHSDVIKRIVEDIVANQQRVSY